MGLIDCFISVHSFSKKFNLQTGVQTFHFLSCIKNRVDFLQPSYCRDIYSDTSVVENLLLEHSVSSINRTFT